MKKTVKIIFSILFGCIVGLGIYWKTNTIQKNAAAVKDHIPYGPYEAVLKRPLEIVLVLILLFVLSPVFVIMAILVRIKLGAPIIFLQKRAGLKEKIFYLYKFRSMTERCGKDGKLLSDEKRLTPFGKLIRQMSIDELPELINILKGDMSMVGPRPLMMEYIPYYTKEEHHRHDVRPGLTGLAQVNGRSFLTWEEIFQYDLEYIKKITFMGDMRIIFQTLIKVCKRENVADVTKGTIDKEGRVHIWVDGKECILHQPLHVEREEKSV